MVYELVLDAFGCFVDVLVHLNIWFDHQCRIMWNSVYIIVMCISVNFCEFCVIFWAVKQSGKGKKIGKKL